MTLLLATPANTLHGAEDAEHGIMQLLLDALPAGALLLDPEGRIVAVNQQAEAFLGWPAAAMAGKPAHEFLNCYLEELANVVENCPIARVLRGKSNRTAARMSVRCRGESVKPVEYRCTPYPTATGLGAILAFNDMTPRLAMEKELRNLASIAEASPIAIVELNQDANLIHANPTMMALMDRFGFGADIRPAVLPHNIEGLTAECLARQTALGGIEVSAGGHFFEWKLVPVRGERAVRGYGIDLTEHKQAELALVQAKSEAEAANLAKTAFLANMSHEIRTPINRIAGMAEILADSGLNQEQLDYANTIQACTASLVGVFEQIIDMAELESGKIELQKSHFDVSALVREVAAPFARPAEEKALRFDVKLSADLPKQIYGDRRRLGQVLANLLSNAVKFTERGAIALEVRRGSKLGETWVVENGAGETCAKVTFAVRDTGIGIVADKINLLFERFSQVDGSSRRRHGGAGLGLAIAKELIDLMGGNIGAMSELGKGSEFWFDVPLLAADRAPAAGEST